MTEFISHAILTASIGSSNLNNYVQIQQFAVNLTQRIRFSLLYLLYWMEFENER